MSNKLFKDLAIGDVFVLPEDPSQEFKKTEEIRVSCCKRVNAVSTSSNTKIKVQDDKEVTIND